MNTTTTKTTDEITDAVIAEAKAEPVSHAKPKAKAAAKPAKAKAKAPAKTAKAKADKPEQKSLDLAPVAAPSQLVMMPLSLVKTRSQVRTEINDETIRELAADIAMHGVLQPILLRPTPGQTTFDVIAGHRRTLAAILAGVESIPAIIGDVTEEYAAEIQLAENIQREDLSLKDLSTAVRKIYDTNQSVTDTGNLLKKSKSWVSKHLAASCPELRQFAKDLLEGGHTEDLEIVLMIDKLQPLDWCGCRDLCEQIKSGNAGRQTVKDTYDAAKTKAEQFRKEQEEKNNPEAVEKRKAEQEATQRQWEAQEKKKEEERQRNPIYICTVVLENFQSKPEDVQPITLAQKDILENHLRGFFDEAGEANNAERLRRVIDLKFNDSNELEIAAFMLGTMQDSFEIDLVLSQVERVIIESIA